MITEFITDQIKKTVIRLATTESIETVNAAAARQYNRNVFVLKVLRAPSGARAYVKNTCLASDSVGQKQLGALLTVFETLSPADQHDYIIAYRRAASLVQGGSLAVALETVWEPGHIPPIPPYPYPYNVP